jgi:hypothetical protein
VITIGPCSLCGSTRSIRWVRRDIVTCEDRRACDRRRNPRPRYEHADPQYNDHAVWRGAGDIIPYCHRCGTALRSVPVTA